MGKGNFNNLVQNIERTPERIREVAVKAGKASGVARRKKKQLNEIARAVMSCDVSEKQKKQLEQFGLSEEEQNQWTLCIMGLLKVAQKNGDVKAISKLQELTGEGCSQTVEEEKQRALLEAFKNVFLDEKGS